MDVIQELLTSPNFGDAETATMYGEFSVTKVKQLARINEQIEALLASDDPSADATLGDEDPVAELTEQFKEIEKSLKPIVFRLRPLGPIALATVQEDHDEAVVRAQSEIERFNTDPETPLDKSIVFDGMPLMLEARLAAAAIVDPVITPQQWIAMLEKFGGAAMHDVIEVKESCINRKVSAEVPKLRSRLETTQT